MASPQALTRWLPPDALPSAGVLMLIVVLPCLAIFATMSGAPVTTATHFLVVLVGVLAFAAFTGNSGILSFGHVAFMGLAAQISATLTAPPALKAGALPDLPDFIMQSEFGLLGAMAITLPLVLLFALLVGLPICRLNGSSSSIATLGLLIIVNSLIIGAQGITRGSQAFYGIPKLVDIPTGIAFAAIAILLVRLYRDSVPGLLLRATRENEAAAQAIGIDAPRQRLIGWLLSAGVAGMSGVLMAHFLTVFTPKEFYFDLTFALIAMLVVGGMSSVSGAVVGAIVITLMIELLRRLENGFYLGDFEFPQIFGLTEVGLSLAILAVLYFRREGIMGFAEIGWLQRGVKPPPAPANLAIAKAVPGQLRTDRLSKAYGGVRAVENVALTLATGEILGLIGPNGSGKTTLLGCIAGTHAPSDGRVRLDDIDVTGLASHQIARLGIGRTFQTIRLFGQLTALENVVAARAQRRPDLGRAALESEAMALLQQLKIADLAMRTAGTLAYGQQRRLEIARALALDPRFMLLDEPAAGMNETESDDLLEILKWLVDARGLGLLIVDHDLRLIMRLCHRIVVLNKGQLIAEGAPAQIQDDAAVKEAYLGRRHDREPAMAKA